MGNRKRRDLVLAIIAATGTLGGLLTGVMVQPALAAGSVTGTVTTSGIPLNVRTGPAISAPRTKALPNGARVSFVCQSAGQKIWGKVRTTNLWDRLPDGTYVSDAYITRAKSVPRCPPPRVSPSTTKSPGPAANGWAAPIPGAVGSGYRTKARPTHDGIDLAARKNTPIRATARGTVITAECNASTNNCDVDGSLKVRGCGWYVELEHADKVVTRYCHMIKKPSVALGQRVRTGQIIGYVGSSGNSTGPHLHFEVHLNAPPADRSNAVGPVSFLRAKGVILR